MMTMTMPMMMTTMPMMMMTTTTTTTTTTMYPGRFAWDYPMADAAAGFGGGDGDDEPVGPFGSRARGRRPGQTCTPGGVRAG